MDHEFARRPAPCQESTHGSDRLDPGPVLLDLRSCMVAPQHRYCYTGLGTAQTQALGINKRREEVIREAVISEEFKEEVSEKRGNIMV